MAAVSSAGLKGLLKRGRSAKSGGIPPAARSG